MATIGRTARGLRRVPRYEPPQAPQPETPPQEESKKRRRPVRYKLFSLGAGLDMPLLLFILVLLAIGLVMLFSASYAYSYYTEDGNSYSYIWNQGRYAVLGLLALFVISTFDYHRFHQLALPIFGISVFFLALIPIFRAVGLSQLVPNQGDAYRWLQLGPLNFPPSEI